MSTNRRLPDAYETGLSPNLQWLSITNSTFAIPLRTHSNSPSHTSSGGTELQERIVAKNVLTVLRMIPHRLEPSWSCYLLQFGMTAMAKPNADFRRCCEEYAEELAGANWLDVCEGVKEDHRALTPVP